MVLVTQNSPIPQDPGVGLDVTQNGFIVTGLLTLSADYGAADSDGDTLDLTGLCPSGYGPRRVFIYQEPLEGNAPVIYNFLYGRGTDASDGRLVVTDFAGAQITQGAAYPAALTDDDPSPNIRFEATFVKL